MPNPAFHRMQALFKTITQNGIDPFGKHRAIISEAAQGIIHANTCADAKGYDYAIMNLSYLMMEDDEDIHDECFSSIELRRQNNEAFTNVEDLLLPLEELSDLSILSSYTSGGFQDYKAALEKLTRLGLIPRPNDFSTPPFNLVDFDVISSNQRLNESVEVFLASFKQDINARFPDELRAEFSGSLAPSSDSSQVLLEWDNYKNFWAVSDNLSAPYRRGEKISFVEGYSQALSSISRMDLLSCLLENQMVLSTKRYNRVYACVDLDVGNHLSQSSEEFTILFPLDEPLTSEEQLTLKSLASIRWDANFDEDDAPDCVVHAYQSLRALK